MIHVDADSFFVIVLVSALAAIAVSAAPGRLVAPVVVLELALGILVGPHVFDIASTDEFIDFFAKLGLGMLFFFAGYEIDFERVRGRPLRLGALGWLLSIGLSFGLCGIAIAVGQIESVLYIGTALATTAMGTLIPILRDEGELHTEFSTYLMAAGGFGVFGPITLLTVFVSTDHPLHEALILLAFVVLAVAVALAAIGLAWRSWPALERTLEASSQLAVRVTVVLIFGLVLLASDIGVDVVIGGFVSGLITRQILRGHEERVFESKLTAIGFGFFVPFFFVVSGIELDLAALGSARALLNLAIFFAGFLVVRGTPALLLYAGVLDLRDRFALALYSATELPLIVAIATIAIAAGHMETATGASLIAAGMLSTLVFPLAAARLRARPRPTGA
ncbi:MAG TPA: cation:proton antiporter [Solirubrobacterales bacterium]|nr:cation:proton antiporter [Solirubrobacterales bacterium]